MSKKLRPKKEFFMIIQGHGVEELDALSFIPVFIKDAGKIMSTFVITKRIEKTLLSHGLTKERIQIIKKMSQESNWPDRMKKLDFRLKNKKNIKKYKAFFEAEFKGGYIIRIPIEGNELMPKMMRPIKEFFIIIQKAGLQNFNFVKFYVCTLN